MEIATEVTYRIYKPLGSINLFCNVTNNLKTLIIKDLSLKFSILLTDISVSILFLPYFNITFILIKGQCCPK